MLAGQAQKEFYVNEAHALIDALLHCTIESEASTPPASPTEGQSWLVGPTPTGAWAGQSGKIALRQSGNWLFAAANDGMRILDRSSGQERRYWGGWIAPNAPNAPSGGTIVDSEARAVLATLIEKLRDAGIFPAS